MVMGACPGQIPMPCAPPSLSLSCGNDESLPLHLVALCRTSRRFVFRSSLVQGIGNECGYVFLFISNFLLCGHQSNNDVSTQLKKIGQD